MTELLNRYDFVYLFDVTNGNPNGDSAVRKFLAGRPARGAIAHLPHFLPGMPCEAPS
jgi:hypothetical protein